MTDPIATLREKVKEENVLHNFKSYNCIFTLAALSRQDVGVRRPPTTMREDYLIISSAGKSKVGFTPGGSGTANAASSLIEAFNTISPGRFNFYFEDIQINSLIGFDGRTALSKATQIDFVVIEPYGINGFFEALQVAAVAAGYTDFRAATFLLGIEIIGYADDIIATPLIAPYNLGTLGNRFFPITITEIELEAGPSGTRYMVKSLPINELMMGIRNEMPANINITGQTVGQILENMMEQINNALAAQFRGAHIDNDYNANNHDFYKIEFPKNAADPLGAKNDLLMKSNVATVFAENANYQFSNPAKEAAKRNQNRVKLGSGDFAVQFRSGALITDCIAAIVRDCELMQQRVTSAINQNVDSYEMIEYFFVHVETKYKDIYNDKLNRYNFDITYQVLPYKIHVNRIPDVASKQPRVVKTNFYNDIVFRKYKYLYTGENRDIVNFSLKLNALYFQQLPLRLGTNDPQASGVNAKVEITPKDPGTLNSSGTHLSELQTAQLSGLDRIELYVNYAMKNSPQAAGENSRPVDTNPYLNMAKNFYYSIQNSIDLIEVELEIVGDPFFLIQGGVGGIRSGTENANTGITLTGEANHMAGEVYISIEFFTPSDIDKNTGLLGGTPNLPVAYSGIYRVVEASSRFYEGQFKQRLRCLRVPGLQLKAANQTAASAALDNPPTSFAWIPDTGSNIS